MCRKRSLENAVIFDGKTRFMSFAIWVTSWFRVPVIVNSGFIALFLLLLRCFGALLSRALDNFVSFSIEGFIEFLMGRTRYLEIFEPRKKSLTTHQSQIENHRRKQYVPTSKKPRNVRRRRIAGLLFALTNFNMKGFIDRANTVEARARELYTKKRKQFSEGFPTRFRAYIRSLLICKLWFTHLLFL